MRSILTIFATFVMVSTSGGCSSDDATKPPPTPPGNDSGVDAGPSCFENPTTSEEILNACTDAVKIEKNPTLPLLGPRGELPPLP